jgi:hypothetical protein
MEATKRMVLVDERFLDHLYRKQDSNWRKPTDQVAKSKLNRQMKGDLDDYSHPDDLKVKKYNQDLVKFLNTKRKIVEETSSPDESAKDKTTETSHSQTDLVDVAVEKIKRKKRKVSVPIPLIRAHINRPKRVRITPKKFAWDEM